MDILNQVVERLTKDELRYLKMYYANAENGERKDSMLLDIVRKSGNDFDEDAAIRKLGYSTEDKNSYYRLKNRVIEDIGDGLTRLYTHKDGLLELLHYIGLFNIYYSKNLYKTCFFYLKKAERSANSIESYELLDIVYDGFIRLSFHMMEINPTEYIERRKENAKLISQLRELDDSLADVSYRLRLTQNFGTSDKNLLNRLREKAKEIEAQTTSHYSKSLQTRIYLALSQVFIQQHNFAGLELLVKDTLQLFENEKWFNKENHELRLRMLTYAANALYKNNKHKESLEYAEKLGAEINEYGKLHYDQFLFFYYNLLMLNNATLNPAKALHHLAAFEQEMRKKKNYYYDTFIFLNRAGLLYDMGKYAEALKSLVKLYVSDGYIRSDKTFKLKVEISELMITFEAGDFETLKRRIEQVKKDYAALIEEKTFVRDFAIVDLLERMIESVDYKKDKQIQSKIKAVLKGKVNPLHQDTEIIQYRGWLERKAVNNV